nr:hypothetical protein CFP56_04610 [Quercus suber]
MNLQVRLLAPTPQQRSSSHVNPQSQVVRASFVIPVTPHETFSSLLAKLQEQVSLGGPKKNEQHASIIGLQNYNRDDLDLTSLIGEVYRADAAREERTVFAVQQAMGDEKGKKRRREEGGVGDRRQRKRSKLTGGVDLAMTDVDTGDGILERRLPPKQGQSKEASHHAQRPGREEVLVPDSQVSMPTPRSVLSAYEAPVSAQKPVISQDPASSRPQKVRNRHSPRKAMRIRPNHEMDAIEDDTELQEGVEDRVTLDSQAPVAQRSPDLLAKVPSRCTKSKGRVKTPRKEGRLSSEGMDSSRINSVLNDTWTPTEDALLLKSLRERLSIRDMLEKYRMRRTVNAARSRRMILAQTYPNGILSPVPGTLSEIMDVHDLQFNDKRRVKPVNLSSNDDAKLKKAIAAGYDPSEIAALSFPQHSKGEIEKRAAQLLPSVLQSEREKEDWPQDHIPVVGWEGEQNLKLRRCLREKLNTKDAYKRYFFDWKFRPVRRKIVAYKQQMLGDGYDQTGCDDTSIVDTSTHEVVTPRSKSQVQSRGVSNAATTQGLPNDIPTVVHSGLSSTTGVYVNNDLDVVPGARPVAIRTERTRSLNKKRTTKQTARDKAGNQSKASMIPEVSPEIAEHRKARGAMNHVMSIDRHKALENLRKKQRLMALDSDEEDLDEDPDAASLLSMNHMENGDDDNDEEDHTGISVDTYDQQEDRWTTPGDKVEDVAPGMIPRDDIEMVASYDPDSARGSTAATAEKEMVPRAQHRDTSKAKKGVTARSGETAVMSDNESADTAVWQNQASAQLLGSPSPSPRPLDKAKSPIIASDSQSKLQRSPSRLRSAQVNGKLCTNVRTQFSLRPDSRPSSQLVQELELSSAQSRANRSQEHAHVEASTLQSRATAQRQPMPMLESQIDEYAIDFASPESSMDTSVASPDAVQIENQHLVERSPEFMMQSSAVSRSQRLRTYESKSPRTPITARARSVPRDFQNPETTMERTISTSVTDCVLNDAQSATSRFCKSGRDASTLAQGKLPRRPNQTTHVSDALRRRGIAMGIRSAMETGKSQPLVEGQQRRSSSLEVQQHSRPRTHAARVDLRSTFGSSQPVTSFHDIENRAVQRESSKKLAITDEQRDRDQHSVLSGIASGQSSPLIDGTLKNAMDLAADPARYHSSIPLSTENINKTKTERVTQPTDEALEESAEEEISRRSQNSSDEQDFSDDVDSDIAGVDYASSTSEGNDDVVHDREVLEIDSEDERFDDIQVREEVEFENANQAENSIIAKAIPEETNQPWSELPGDNPLMYPGNDDEEKSDTEALIDDVLRGLPLQSDEPRRKERNPNHISQGLGIGATGQTSILFDDVSVDRASDVDSDITSTSVPSTSSSGETDDEVSDDTTSGDRRPGLPKPLLEKFSAKASGQRSEIKNDDVLESQTLPLQNMLSDGEPRQAGSNMESPISSNTSSEGSSSESDSDELSDDSGRDDFESEEFLRNTGQQGQTSRDSTRDREQSRERFIARFNANSPIASAPTKDTTSTFDEVESRHLRDKGDQLSQPELGSRPQPAQDNASPLHTVPTPAVASRIDRFVSLPDTMAPPASTAPATLSSLKGIGTSFRVKLPHSSPSIKTSTDLPQHRFHLSALLGKATSIPASSQKLHRGQPVKRSLPNISDDDDDDDDDGSDGMSSPT